MINDVIMSPFYFMSLLAIVFFVCEVSLQIFCPLFLLSFVLFLSCESSLHILDTSPFTHIFIADVFFWSAACFFNFLVVSLEMQKILILIKSNLSIFMGKVMFYLQIFA